MSDLTAKPLRYLIALEQATGDLVETGYDADSPGGSTPAKYCNLRDEKDSGRYGPYLPPDDIDSEYGEPAPDPDYPGFWQNLDTQLGRAAEQGFHYVELDNLDTYSVSVAVDCFNHCDERHLGVFVKNPLMVEGDSVELLQHSSAVLVIVEEDCGGPTAMEELRVRAGKPTLPVRFVSYGTDDSWAQECARIVQQRHFVDMGVTHSYVGEYASSQDVILPTVPQSETPTVSITTSGNVRIVVNGEEIS
jgi:hypothetical protein